MTERKQHKVGERFEMCKLIYEVRESLSCEGCSFFIEEENHCTDGHDNNLEPCSSIDRDDRKSVIFVQVGEAKEEGTTTKNRKLHPIEIAARNASFDIIGYIRKKYKERKIATEEDGQAFTLAEDFLLKDLPPCVSLLPNDWEGETTRMSLTFAVSRQAVINEKFDVQGFIKAKFDNMLKEIRNNRDVDELHLIPLARVTIDPMNGREKVQIQIHIEYANEKEL